MRRVGMGLMREPARSSGFGLIELMIALVLGLLVMGAAFAVFQSNQATYRANEGLNRIQENARVAFELMSRDLRSAGGSACSTASLVEPVSGSESQTALFRDSPVTGTGSEFTVTSADDTSYRVTAATATSVTLDSTQIANAQDAFGVNDWLMICNARKTFVVKATSVSTSTIGFATLPESYNPHDDEYAPPAAVVVARLRSTRWYLDGTTLRVSRLGGAGEEVVNGVQSLAVTYLERGASSYVASPGNWANVVGVRTNMVLNGQYRERDGNNQTLSRSVSNVVNLRSRTL